jgi:replicative DNA helicase
MIEQTILSGLINNEDYTRKVLPFIKPEYFHDRNEQILYKSVVEYVEKYNGLPTKEALTISIGERTDLNQQQFGDVSKLLNSLSYDDKTDLIWLVDKTEKFCQDKAVYNAVRESILILDNEHKSLDKGSIPELLSTALGVSFDTHIGHDFIENSDERYEFYHKKEDKIAFDIDLLNDITKGGVSKKALIIALAGTGVGKSLFMCHCAASNLMAGLNVLYITLEMAEERIAERIDANLLDLTLDELRDIPKDVYVKRIDRVKSKTNGKLIVKEYPTASAGSAHFRHLMNELKLKRNFTPDVVYIDYLNICMSSRLRNASNVNSYTYIKAIAEELRGLAVEFNVPVISATQTTRSGYSNSDMDLTDTSESFGLPATADFMFGLISTEELEQLGQIMIKQLKNRWGDINHHKRFVVGIDRSKMRLFNVENAAQDLVDDRPVMDNQGYDDVSTQDNVMRFDKRKPNFQGFT